MNLAERVRDEDHWHIPTVEETPRATSSQEGRLGGKVEAALVAGGAPIDSDVLKVGHHGSRGSSSAQFLDSVSPAIAVISVGEDNRFGHPHDETLGALARHVSEDLLFLTRDRGTVEFITDGKTLKLKTKR